MADTETEVANMALAHLGQSRTIDDLETGQDQQAISCRAFMETARQDVLREFDWAFARKRAQLTVVTSASDDDHADPDWNYAYREPPECLAMRRVWSGARVDTESSKIPYDFQYDADGTLILCDEAEAYAQYTIDVTNPARWKSDFTLAVSYRLAELAASGIMGPLGEAAAAKMRAKYLIQVGIAQANSMNEIVRDQEPSSSFERSRE